MEKVEDRLFSANLLALAGIAMLMMLGISTIFQNRRALTMTEATERRSRLSRFGRWVAELLLVFVGLFQKGWLTDSNHWIIQVIHLLLGIAAIGLGEMIGGRSRRITAKVPS